METTRPSLLLRIRDAKDDASWATFHAIYRPLILRFARGRGVDTDDAEDICQQVLAVVHAEIRTFEYDRNLGSFKAWLRQLVMHRVGSLFRHREVRRRGEPLLKRREAELHSPEPTPEQSFESIWMEEHLWHVLGELAQEVETRTIQVYHAFVLDQRPIEEVAAEYEVSVQNVHTIKWRLTRRIAARMKDLTGETGPMLEDDGS